MWNLTNTPPVIIEAEVFTRVPDEFAIRKGSEWSDANRFGGEVRLDSTLDQGTCVTLQLPIADRP